MYLLNIIIKMIRKICIFCKNTFDIDQTNINPYILSNFNKKKYCSRKCRIEFNNKKQIQKNVYHSNKLNIIIL